MTDTIYLTFPSQQDAEALLFASVKTDMGEVLLPHAGICVDVIGVIYKPTGETAIAEGIEVPLTRHLNGWHVNVITLDDVSMDLIKSMQPYVVHVDSPFRVVAGAQES